MPPPGWYADPTGALRWWDGQHWGPAAPPVAGGVSASNTKALATLSHLGNLLGGFVLPLVIFLTADKRDRYLRHHAAEGLNFQITFGLVWLGGFLLFFVFGFGGVALAGDSSGVGAAFGIVFVLFWLLMMATMVASWVLGILGAVRASQGVWWRYPVCVRFVKVGREGAAGPADATV